MRYPGRKIHRHGKFYVYILECNDGTYYTGYSNDLEKRIKEHNDSKRGAKYLRGKGPVKVAWTKEYKYLCYAIRAEYRIKQLNRKQKELLVSGMRLDKVFSKKSWKKTRR